ncbi:serine hydrolase domain-containing protein [soil metagenome]
MKRHLISAAIALGLLAAVGCAPTAPTPDPGPPLEQRLQDAVDQARGQNILPGAIALVDTPAGSYTVTSGTVGEGFTAQPGPDDRTRIGSLTKTMTATILLQLVQEKKVELSDLVSAHLAPSVLAGLPNSDTVTLLDLAHMTSGIQPYSLSEEFQADLFADTQAIWTPEELLSYAVASKLPAKFTHPGSGWQYSHTNYILLGMVIEQIDQKPLSQVFQDRLFGPLGMTDTSFPEPAEHTMAAPNLSGLTEQGQPDGLTTDATDWNPSEAWSAGGVVSTLADLDKWAHALFTGEGVLDAETQQLRRDSILYDLPPLTATSGYGIGIGDNNGWWGHDGQIPGYTSSLQHNYDTDTTVIVLANSDIAPPGGNPARSISEAVRDVIG